MTQRPFFLRRFDRRFDLNLKLWAAVTLSAFGLAGCGEAESGATAPATSASSAVSSAVSSVAEDSAPAVSANNSAPAEQTFASAWGPAAGSQIPKLAASDHKSGKTSSKV